MLSIFKTTTRYGENLQPTVVSDLAVRLALDLSAGVPAERKVYLMAVSDERSQRTWRGWTGRKFALETRGTNSLFFMSRLVQEARTSGQQPRVVIGDANWAGKPVSVTGYKHWNIL